MRLLIAGGIALFALISYYSMGQENPVTGERQRVAINEEQEIRMGLAAVDEMASQHGGLHPDRNGQNLVDQVGFELLAAVDEWVRRNGRQNPYRESFAFHLLRDGPTEFLPGRSLNN